MLHHKFDAWLEKTGPAALVINEYLMSVEGPDGVIFPPTYAKGTDSKKGEFPGGYMIDRFDDGTNICMIDRDASQANRVEPIFGDEYEKLIPQVVVWAAGKRVKLTEVGHRAADALVRCSGSKVSQALDSALRSVTAGNSEPLARIAPTSLIFGVWDSRGDSSRAKIGRIYKSEIRAYNVKELRRGIAYAPAVDYRREALIEEFDNDFLSNRGFNQVVSSEGLGGVVAESVRRDANVNLVALRNLRSMGGPEATKELQRYILGLTLVAFTYPGNGDLRQGCNLVRNPEAKMKCQVVNYDGTRPDLDLSHDDAVAFAKAAALAFGVDPERTIDFKNGPDLEAEFDSDKANMELKDADPKKKSAKK